MKSAFSVASPAATSLTLFSISKALNRGFPRTDSTLLARCLHTRIFAHRRLAAGNLASISSSSYAPLRALYAASAAPELRRRLQCLSTSVTSFGAGGGDGDAFGGGDGGGGGNGPNGGDSEGKLGPGGGADDLSALSPDVIILDVGGMVCGGCAASVKRILESQPQVSSASVNLTTETALVWPVSQEKAEPNWRQQLGEVLAKQLTDCGFKSNPRVAGPEGTEEDTSN